MTILELIALIFTAVAAMLESVERLADLIVELVGEGSCLGVR